MFNWKLCYAENKICKNSELKTIKDIKKSGFSILDTKVPGSLQTTLMDHGIIDDLYYSDNTISSYKLENMHVWYFSEFEIEDTESYIHFGGIDTISDIYVNGILVKSTDNMFIEYDVYPKFKKGVNQIVIHLKPVMIEARKYTSPAFSSTSPYTYSQLYIRKPAHSYGWDIMPRILTIGLWKNVEIRKIKKDCLNEVYLFTQYINYENNSAILKLYLNCDLSNDFAQDYTVKLQLSHNGIVHSQEYTMWHNTELYQIEIEDAKLWWPKNYGSPELYDVKVELYFRGELCDTKEFKHGIRKVELNYTDVTDGTENGCFGFKINNKKIFVLGTNWVCLDAFHEKDNLRLEKALKLVSDINCNAVRCWGGNVYESDEFYDYCDKNGIMVWQDFAMACAIYPHDANLTDNFKKEAEFQIKRLRNHASLILWAGDNECDLSYSSWTKGLHLNPEQNIITRKILKELVLYHAPSTPYLPSSPLVSDKMFDVIKNPDDYQGVYQPEKHLWGPRDYFKGDFYKNSFCHFASETGYHGFPSTSSLNKFLKEPEKLFNEDGQATDEYKIHASSVETFPDATYNYRIRLAYNQVKTLFTTVSENLDDFVMQSQISQGEAKKYFIEKFRIQKYLRTGIIWWNLLDGWPQVSDAIVDYYFIKKLAYNYIKRSQEPLCLIFDEPENNILNLYAVNDTQKEATISYKVTNIYNDKVVLEGNKTVNADCSVKIDELSIKDNEKIFYLIEWECDGKIYKNHYHTNIIDIDYNNYLDALKKCKFDEFEGF